MEVVIFLITLGMVLAIAFIGIGVVIGAIYQKPHHRDDYVRIYHPGDYRLVWSNTVRNRGKEKR